MIRSPGSPRRRKGSGILKEEERTNFSPTFLSKDYITTVYSAWGQFLLENLLANPVILKCIHQVSESCSVMSNSLQPHGLYSPWNSPGQNTGVGSCTLFQGIFPSQGSNWDLPTLQADSLPAVAQTVNHLPTVRETWVQSLGREGSLEKEMATHSSILAWKIPWAEEPSRLQSMGSPRVGHDWGTSLTKMYIMGVGLVRSFYC